MKGKIIKTLAAITALLVVNTTLFACNNTKGRESLLPSSTTSETESDTESETEESLETGDGIAEDPYDDL